MKNKNLLLASTYDGDICCFDMKNLKMTKKESYNKDTHMSELNNIYKIDENKILINKIITYYSELYILGIFCGYEEEEYEIINKILKIPEFDEIYDFLDDKHNISNVIVFNKKNLFIIKGKSNIYFYDLFRLQNIASYELGNKQVIKISDDCIASLDKSNVFSDYENNIIEFWKLN